MEGVDVQMHVFLNSALVGDECTPSRPSPIEILIKARSEESLPDINTKNCFFSRSKNSIKGLKCNPPLESQLPQAVRNSLLEEMTSSASLHCFTTIQLDKAAKT
jgi:hypothetical protein